MSTVGRVVEILAKESSFSSADTEDTKTRYYSRFPEAVPYVFLYQPQIFVKFHLLVPNQTDSSKLIPSPMRLLIEII